MNAKRILVLEKELYGIHCGKYAVYEKSNPDKVFRHLEPAWLPEFFDSCVLDPIMGVHWDCCEVKSLKENYTVEFDLEYKRELAKSLIAKLIALDNAYSLAEGEDVVAELETQMNDANPFPFEDLLMDYAGLTDRYAWIFTDDFTKEVK